MKIAELLIFILLIATAVLFKEKQIVNAGSFVSLFMLSLILLNFIAGWYLFEKINERMKSLWYSIPLSLANSLLALAILFKLNNWLVVSNLFIAAIVLLGIILIVGGTNFFKARDDKDKTYFKYLIVRTFISILVALVFILKT